MTDDNLRLRDVARKAQQKQYRQAKKQVSVDAEKDKVKKNLYMRQYNKKVSLKTKQDKLKLDEMTSKIVKDYATMDHEQLRESMCQLLTILGAI